MSYITDKFNEGEVKFKGDVAGRLFEDGEFRPLQDGAMDELYQAGLVDGIQVEATRAATEEYTNEVIARYLLANQDGPSDEERAEARAVHGAGVEMVNVITGERWIS